MASNNNSPDHTLKLLRMMGLSIRKLADRVGVSHQTVSNVIHRRDQGHEYTTEMKCRVWAEIRKEHRVWLKSLDAYRQI